jgi:hypothetical protein
LAAATSMERSALYVGRKGTSTSSTTPFPPRELERPSFPLPLGAFGGSVLNPDFESVKHVGLNHKTTPEFIECIKHTD